MNQLINLGEPFALIKRRSDPKVLCLSGSVSRLTCLDAIPRRQGAATAGEEVDSLSVLPFRLVEELGFAARHNHEPILCLKPERQFSLGATECLSILPDDPVCLQAEGVFTPDDEGYAARVQRIIDDEIGRGEGCNFVVPRRYRAKIAQFSQSKALSCFRRLLQHEYGAYWTFLVYTGEQYFIGATPERHLSCRKGVVKMNPISGTLRKDGLTPANTPAALQAFLADRKEILELLMVTDEELKMMAGLCRRGGQIVGPLLREMSSLIHSEYVLTGHSDMDVIDMLRQSMFAATVTGSPIENACRVICRHDQESRRYYGSALALIGRDEQGQDTLDSPITIRMAEIDLEGNLEIGVGGTLVWNSIPAEEVAETHAKAAALIGVLSGKCRSSSSSGLGESLYSEDVMISLASRNARLSRFWIEDQSLGGTKRERFRSRKITMIDNGDNFIRLLSHMMRAMGAGVQIESYKSYAALEDDADLVVLGPGPGDPRDLTNEKIARLSAICAELLCARRPLFGVCLGHQILCGQLGIPIVQKATSFQGVQEAINLWGVTEHVGFYNAFAGGSTQALEGADISRDERTGEIHAIRGNHYVGVQFHPESVLTTNGYGIVEDILAHLLERGSPSTKMT